MNISSVYPNSPSGNSAPQQGAGVDSKGSVNSFAQIGLQTLG